jgi:type VI secretion system protein ImpJ
MRQTQKVLWTKGVLLSPQHLQTQDRFLEDLLEFQLSSLLFAPWGFSRLEVDREQLAGGSLVISSAAGIFPDGLAFDTPLSDAAPSPKPLADQWEADQTELDLYLAIPEHQLGGHNVSSARANRDSRYTAEVLMRRDENTGLAERPIQVGRKNLRLLTGNDNLEGHTLLQVGRAIRSAAGGLELDPRSVPPLLDISASDYLLSIARRLVEILSARSASLSGMRRQRNQSLADFGVADVANFWLLYTVNTHLPRFRHLFETRRGHPNELFSAMLALAGALTTFSAKHHPRSLPAYQHDDLGRCFTTLDGLLRELLETVVPATHASLPLQLTQPSIYATAIDQDRYFAAPQAYLAISTSARQDELLRKAPQLIKVSSADQIDRLIRQALPGVPMHHVPSPPSALPVKLNYHYFLLDRSGPDWEAIRITRNLAAYVPSDFPDPVLELVFILPPDRGGAAA